MMSRDLPGSPEPNDRSWMITTFTTVGAVFVGLTVAIAWAVTAGLKVGL